MSTIDMINEYHKKTAQNHEKLKKDCIDNYYNRTLGAIQMLILYQKKNQTIILIKH